MNIGTLTTAGTTVVSEVGTSRRLPAKTVSECALRAARATARAAHVAGAHAAKALLERAQLREQHACMSVRSCAGVHDRRLLARLHGSRSPCGMQHGSEQRLLDRLLGTATMNNRRERDQHLQHLDLKLWCVASTERPTVANMAAVIRTHSTTSLSSDGTEHVLGERGLTTGG